MRMKVSMNGKERFVDCELRLGVGRQVFVLLLGDNRPCSVRIRRLSVVRAVREHTRSASEGEPASAGITGCLQYPSYAYNKLADLTRRTLRPLALKACRAPLIDIRCADSSLRSSGDTMRDTKTPTTHPLLHPPTPNSSHPLRQQTTSKIKKTK